MVFSPSRSQRLIHLRTRRWGVNYAATRRLPEPVRFIVVFVVTTLPLEL